MGEKFSYAIKFLKIQYWKLEEQILRLETENADCESYSNVHTEVANLKIAQDELKEAIKLLEDNQ